MPTILVTGAAGSAGLNLIECLLMGEEPPRIVAVDMNRWHLELFGPMKEHFNITTYVAPRSKDPEYVGFLNELIERHEVDLVVPQPDLDVQKGGLVTHLDRGQALQKLLISAIDKLRPPGPEPSRPAREWHQYIILHDAYVLGELNRDIMAKLYIGEGTFNRARRRAIRGVARALGEMERQAQRKSPM